MALKADPIYFPPPPRCAVKPHEHRREGKPRHIPNPNDIEKARASTTTESSAREHRRSWRLLPNSKLWDLVDHWWLFELLSLLFAFCCTAAIISVLLCYQDRPLPDWPMGLTVNAYVSVFGAFIKASLLLPIAEALGQLKFLWFAERTRDIQDFQTFDQASRGPWGALLLVLKTRGRALGALGAAVMLLSVAMDPFFQQLVVFPIRYVPSPDASISRATLYTAVDDASGLHINGSSYIQPDGSTRYYLTSMLYSKEDKVKIPDVPHTCPTSNCNFGPYETLAVCSQCADISDLLDFTCQSSPLDWISNVTDPSRRADQYGSAETCGYYLNATSGFPALVTGYSVDPHVNETLLGRVISLNLPVIGHNFYDGSFMFKNITQPLFDFIVVAAANGYEGVHLNQTPIAQECVLSYCVQTLNTSIVNGTIHDEILGAYQGNTTSAEFWTADYYPYNGGWVEYTYVAEPPAFRPPGSNVTFGLTSNQTAFEIGMSFLFGGAHSFITADRSSAVPNMRLTWDTMQALLAVPHSPWIGPGVDVPAVAKKIATGMTAMMRSAVNGTELIQGTALTPQTYVSVRWGWLTFPVAILLVATVFVLGAIYQSGSSDMEIWKTSALAVLLHGLQGSEEVRKEDNTAGNSGKERASLHALTSGSSKAQRGPLMVNFHKRRGKWRFSRRLSRL